MVAAPRRDIDGHFRVAEFFAGAGLVREALQSVGGDVVFANDIEPFKHAIYAANFDARDFVLGDVRGVTGKSVPTVDLATSSLLCCHHPRSNRAVIAALRCSIHRKGALHALNIRTTLRVAQRCEGRINRERGYLLRGIWGQGRQ